MGKKEIFLSIIFIVISITIYILTYQFPQQTVALSPKVFPRFVSTCLFILSITLLIQGIAGVKKNSEQKKTKLTLNKIFILRLLLMILLAFFYTRILSLTGYIIATPPFVAGTMLLFNEKRWIWIIAVSIITTALLYVLFRMIFRVPLPRFDLF
ncbi:MAG: tripartite tricarboxylate transporter TctB family protein [Candidatus Atribacteria bacterium]